MQFVTQNGWTRERMKAEIMSRMLGHQSGNDITCLYRAADGNRCAVGVFIPDDVYVKEMDAGIAVSAEVVIPTYTLEPYMPLDTNGMSHMQMVHDSPYSVGHDPRPRLLEWIDCNVIDANEEA